MVIRNTSTCTICGGSLKYYDSVPRIVRTKGRFSEYVKIRRLRCLDCRHIQREIPDNIYPYKQYESELIKGVIEGYITSETIGYEDYPCEETMKRWKTQHKFDMEISEEFIFSHILHFLL